jgi:hypothetical protein
MVFDSLNGMVVYYANNCIYLKNHDSYLLMEFFSL